MNARDEIIAMSENMSEEIVREMFSRLVSMSDETAIENTFEDELASVGYFFELEETED